MNLTRNFTMAEFNCHDGTQTPDELLPNLQTLAENLQVLRDYLGFPIQINSGYRSKEYNAKIGGSPKSAHLKGMAADIRCIKYTPAQVREAILKLIADGKMTDGGIGFYDTFIHYDISTSRRWDLRKHK